MCAKNLKHNAQKINAQAKINGSAQAKTKKAWQNAKNAGQSQRKRVYVLICACVLLLCLAGTQIFAFFHMHKQWNGVSSGKLSTRKCHQGRFTRQATTKVSVSSTYNTSINWFDNKMQTNTQKQCKGNFVSGKVCGRATIFAAQTGQKPSAVSGVSKNRRAEVPVDSKASRGLITPKKTHADKHYERLQKIRRLVAKLRQRRQNNIGLKKWRERVSTCAHAHVNAPVVNADVAHG